MKDSYREIDFTENILADDMLAKKFTSKYRNDLPDSDFAYIEPGGKKVDGKTEPRSLRHFPIPDAAHVRNALARLSQSKLSPAIKAKILKKLKAKAKEFGIKVSETKAYHNDPATLEDHFKEMHKHLLDKEYGQDSYDVAHENLKELRKHHEGAIKNIDKEIERLQRDKGADKRDLTKE